MPTSIPQKLPWMPISRPQSRHDCGRLHHHMQMQKQTHIHSECVTLVQRHTETQSNCQSIRMHTIASHPPGTAAAVKTNKIYENEKKNI